MSALYRAIVARGEFAETRVAAVFESFEDGAGTGGAKLLAPSRGSVEGVVDWADCAGKESAVDFVRSKLGGADGSGEVALAGAVVLVGASYKDRRGTRYAVSAATGIPFALDVPSDALREMLEVERALATSG